MKKSYWITLITGIAIALGIYATSGVSQQQPAATQQQAPIPYLVAVIDIAEVIQRHPEFTQRQEAFRQEITRVQAEFQKREGDINTKKKNMEAAQVRPGTAEHQRMFDDIASDMATLEKDMKLAERQFILLNSRIMYDVYKDIKETIGKYARATGIAQVTDQRKFEPDAADPQSVAEDMDQRLVWYSERLDITEYIVSQLWAARGQQEPQRQQTAGAAGAAQRTATAPGAPAQGQPMMQR